MLSNFKPLWFTYWQTEQDEAAVRGTEQHEAAVRGTEQDEAAVRGTEQHEAAVRGTEQDEAAVRGTEQDEAAVRGTEQDEAAVRGTEQDEAAVRGTEQDDAAVRGTEQHEAAVRGTEQDEAAVRGTEQDDAAVRGTEQDEAAVRGTEQDEAAVRGTEQHEAAVRGTEQEEDVNESTKKVNFHKKVCTNMKQRETILRARNLAKQLYHDESFRCPETIQQLSEDLELAEITMKVYMTHFNFRAMSLSMSFRSVLKVFWPEDNREIQHILITHFSRWYLLVAGQSLAFQPAIYSLCWSMIILNADLNGGHKGRKMTWKEYVVNLNYANLRYRYYENYLWNIYISIKMKPLEVFTVRTRCQTVGKNETSIPSADDNPATTVHKTGNLICKRVMDENGRKTRKGQRSWKSFTAVLKGMVLHLEKDASDLRKADSKNAIRLHHAIAYQVDYKNRPHVLCLRTADSRLFYFQAESEVEQTSWTGMINLIAARYSAPPLTSASHSISEHCPQALPSYPTPLSIEQQLEHHEDRLQRISEHLLYYMSLPFWDRTFEYVVRERKRYTTYVGALRQLVSGT